jgi:glycine hydroxymethyltransferase
LVDATPDEVIAYTDQLKRLVDAHENWRTKTTLNLLAAENFASSETRSFLSTDLSNRYTARDKFYRGTKFADEIEELAGELAKKLFRAKFADIRPLSGHTCSLILFMSFLKPGDKVLTCPPQYGGYPGSSELGLGPLLYLKNLYFPYDPEAMNILSEKSRVLIGNEEPQVTVFGSSFIPFPQQVRPALPEDYSGVKAFDGSHVLGLIAGGEFQKPLEEGCDLLMGSTHKTFFGPQGGLIVSNNEQIFETINSKIFPGIVDNIHLNRVASLSYAMIEMLKFGKQYATQVVRNSKALAKTLYDLGVPVKCASHGFTKSHQVLLNFSEEESVKVADRLQDLDIIADTGIRLGTSEVTRRGMKEVEMEMIGSIIHDALNNRAEKDQIRDRVHHLVRAFNSIEFSLA